MEHARTSTRRGGARVFGIPGDDFAISEADHRIANSLSLLAGAVSMRGMQIARERQELDSEQAADLLREIAAQIAAVGQLHRALSREPEAEALDLGEHLFHLCRELLAALDPSGGTELVRSAGDRCLVPSGRVVSVCLIVAELVINALKHAHRDGGSGRIFVGCRKEADGGTTIEVRDDGDGLPEGFDPARSDSLGFRTIDVLTQRLEGELRCASDRTGTRFTLRLPPAPAE